MYVILVYDAGIKRDPKILKTCRQYLNWVQNSVFEGEITEGKLRQLTQRLKDIVNPAEDYILIYTIPTFRYASRMALGTPKVSEGDIV